jgi:hypothetical protein
MATSSITKNFIISGEDKIEKFARAIEASAISVTPALHVEVTQLQNEKDIKLFMKKRVKTNE